MEPEDTKTRDKVLKTTVRLLAKSKPAKLTIRQIAAGAGVNVAAINYHFAAKKISSMRPYSRSPRKRSPPDCGCSRSIAAPGRAAGAILQRVRLRPGGVSRRNGRRHSCGIMNATRDREYTRA